MAIYHQSFDIVMAVFDIGQNVVAECSRCHKSGDTNIDIESTLEQMRASMETMGIGELLGLSIETLLISLCLKIMSILITVILYGRMIDLLHREHRAHSHCDDEQPRMGQHRHELPQRAVRAGIPRLPHHGVRCDLCPCSSTT